MRGYRISKWLRSSCPSSLLKHGLTEQTFQDHVQMPFEHLQGLGFHHCHREAFPDLSHPQSKKVFPDGHTELLGFQPVPIASCPVPGRECLCYDCSL